MVSYKAVALVGDAVYNGFYVPKEEIEKAHMTMKGRTFVIDHNPDIIGVVGFIDESFYEAPSMVNVFSIDESLEASDIALKWINKIFERDEIPEVSVSFSAKVADFEDWYDDETPTLIDLKFIHLALVTAGACSPDDGCGIVENEWYKPMEYRRIGDYKFSMGKYRVSEPDEAGRVTMEMRFGMKLEEVETMTEKKTEDKPVELELSDESVKIKLGDCVSIVTQLETVNAKLLEKVGELTVENKVKLEANVTLRKRVHEVAAELQVLQMTVFAEDIEDEEKITAPVEVETPIVKLSDDEHYDRVTQLLNAGGRKRVKTLRDED